MVSLKYIDLRIRTYIYGLCESKCDCPWMNIMLAGNLEYIVNGTPVVLTAGHVAYFKEGEIVGRREQYSDVRYLSMRFTSDEDDSMIHRIVPIIGERQNTLVDLLQSYYFGSELGELENHRAAEHILCVLIKELQKNCQNTELDERINKIRKYVLMHFGNGIKPQDVAKHMALHPSYCNTMYKNATGETIGQLIDRRRIEHATSRLQYSQLSIKEIAGECGFKDLYYFSKWFSRHTMCSPTDFRQKSNEK